MNNFPATRPLLLNASFIACFFCQLSPAASRIVFRQLSSNTPPSPLAPVPRDEKPPIGPEDADTKDKDFTPTRLLRPLGMDHPPQKGENSGVDTRTLQQKRDDFVNWDKHLAKRKRLTSQFGTSYFRDFNTMTKEHKGKSWIAPQRLFRADKSLYFPNLQGRTLVPPRKVVRDTTDVLITPSPGTISVVAVFSSMWGQNQVATLMDDPAVAGVIEENKGKVQRVDINIEENTLKAMLITLFLPSLRKQIPKDRHDKYFIVKQGVTEELRSQVGLVNGRVGYVYLVDSQGRIRWAASGIANDEEKEALVKGVRRLVDTLGTEEDVVAKEAAAASPVAV